MMQTAQHPRRRCYPMNNPTAVADHPLIKKYLFALWTAAAISEAYLDGTPEADQVPNVAEMMNNHEFLIENMATTIEMDSASHGWREEWEAMHQAAPVTPVKPTRRRRK